MNKLPNPFILENSDFPRGFNIEAFMNEIDPLPVFLESPSPEYLQAAELIPVLEILAGHL